MKPKFKKILTLTVTGTFLAAAGTILALGKATPVKTRTSRKTRKTVAHKKAVARSAIKITATPKDLIKPVTDESSEMDTILASTTGLKPEVLKLGLNAYNWAEKKGKVRNDYLTIVDFSIPSKDKRLWVINMKTDKVVFKELVANGKNSGLYKGTRFSNTPRSLQSSLGVYVTGVTYYGNDGLSMHVHGLQPGVNSNAYSREIEFHGAWYVSPTFASEHGRVGRSWGCFAMNKPVLPAVVNTIKGGSVVFAYANNHNQDFTVEGA